MSGEFNLEFEETEEFFFLLKNRNRRNGLVCNLLRHDLRVKGQEVFVFGGEVHADDTDCVNFLVAKS